MMVKMSGIIAVAATATIFITSCSTGNVTNDKNKANTGSYQGYTQGQGNDSNILVNYKDGIYTAQGDKHESGNESATITIIGGKIIGVSLNSIDSQGKSEGGSIAGSGIAEGGKINNAGSASNVTPDINSNEGSIGGTGNQSKASVGKKVTSNNTGSTSITHPDYTAAGDASEARTELANTMLLKQTYNVEVTSRDPGMNIPINNWKLAAKRALEKASK